MTTVLIVNADDFGRCAEISAGIVRGHVAGIVTSTSAMVRHAVVEPALRAAADHPRLGVGLHLDFGEWAYREGQWAAVYEVVDLGDEAAVEREAGRQLERFRALAQREPTHVDSHQHVHRAGPALSVARRLADELGVPLRQRTPGIGYCGGFYGRTATGDPFPEGITVPALVTLIDGLSAGVTELCCHPGEAGVGDPGYGSERAEELRTLCDERVRAAVRRCGITLTSFAAFAGLSVPSSSARASR